MTDDFYLVAHKVRGEPAFDIATRIPCPLCAMDVQGAACHECDSLGYWWIVPTSGHRAYPYWHRTLTYYNGFIGISQSGLMGLVSVPDMPPDLPDHYTTREAPAISLISALGIRPAALPPLKRRF